MDRSRQAVSRVNIFLRSLLGRSSAGRKAVINRRRRAGWNTRAIEFLEDRALLANIAVTGARLRDFSGSTVTTPFRGEMVALEVSFQTADLDSADSYDISFSIDGTTVTTTGLTYGAGLAFGNWFVWRSGWFATNASHDVVIQVDSGNSIAETLESDNVAVFSFSTSVTPDLPQLLVWPLDGAPQSELRINNYLDVDPRSGQQSDYFGGVYTYDGHDAWDIGPGVFGRQDDGIPVYAAADGVITTTQDGQYDRQETWITPAPDANYVRIDHGAGWETIYWHLRRDSIIVAPGQSVKAGDLIGYMGSSGISTGTHLHFGLRHHAMPVEPMLYPFSYFDLYSIPTYSGTSTRLQQSYATNYDISNDFREPASSIDVFPSASPSVTVAALFSGFDAGDVVTFEWRRPNGTIYTTDQTTVSTSNNGWWYWWNHTLPVSADIGLWRVDFRVNGSKIGEQRFNVQATGAPEIRVETSAGDPILDGRVTPVDFGAVALNDAAPSETFQLINHGYEPLSVQLQQLPTGFTTSFPATPVVIQPGNSTNLTISLDTTKPGTYLGNVVLSTNDSSEQFFSFTLEGAVSAAATESLKVVLSERNLPERGWMQGQISRTGNTGSTVTARIRNPQPDQLDLVGGTMDYAAGVQWLDVVFPIGVSSAFFTVNAIEDHVSEGTMRYELMAESASYQSSWVDLTVRDAAPLAVSYAESALNNASITLVNSSTDPTRVRLVENGVFRRSLRLADVSTLTLNLQGNSNSILLDYSNGTPLPEGGLTITGGTQTALTLNNGTVGNSTNVMNSKTGGLLTVDDIPITYSSVLVLNDYLDADLRALTWANPVTDATLQQSIVNPANTLLSSSGSPFINFESPSQTLRVQLANGTNHLTISSLGSDFLPTISQVTGGSGDDTLQITAFAGVTPWWFDGTDGSDTLILDAPTFNADNEINVEPNVIRWYAQTADVFR
ncbi:MAG: peptidoglycan DD-metalloendopeptidase family protein, partial [Planctomycetaceae bacterium]|nr:peptidoglycan DD-metalloendopeptidase family protein [Planctomycetaceae bacterium]